MNINKNEKMTSKERVLRTFNHQEVDRVPINYASNPDIHSRLLSYYNLKDKDYESLLQILGVDFRPINVPYIGQRLHKKIPDRRIDPAFGIRTRWVEHENGGYWDFCDFPLKNASLEEVNKWPMPSVDDYDYSNIENLCEKYKEYALYIGNPGLGDIINSTGMLRSMEQVLIDLALDDPAGLKLIDRKLEIQYEVTKRTLEIANDKIDFMWIGEDLGTQNSPILSKPMFRKYIRPRHQLLIDLAKEYDLPVMIHSCGSSSWAFDDFIEMGIDVVDTLQPEAKDMNPAYLKEKYGDKLAFHGCISTAGPLAYGTVEDVIRDVKETLKIMMPGGGYCLAPTHQIQDNSPTENVVAMYETAHKYGSYK